MQVVGAKRPREAGEPSAAAAGAAAAPRLAAPPTSAPPRPAPGDDQRGLANLVDGAMPNLRALRPG